MRKIMLIDAVHPEEMRMVITDDKSSIHEFDFTTSAKKQIKGNIYLAKVTRVEPSLQAAFVEYGGGKQGFLPFAEIHTDYYQIPISDRQRLMEEEEAMLAEIAAEAENGEDSNDRAERGGEHRDRDRDRGGRRRNRGRNRRRRFNDEGENTANTTLTSEDGSNSEAFEDTANFREDTEITSNDNAESTMSESAGIMALPSISAPILDEATEEDDSNADFPATSATEVGESAITEGDSAADIANTHEESADTEIETLSSEEEIERPRRRTNLSRRYKIQEVIKRNQIMLVQVIKEERGNKGVSLTTFLSLAGRYCVLMPNSPRGGGVSRKINTGDDRKRLKSIISDLQLPQGMSLIIRTAGSDRTKTEIKRDFDYLVKLWNQIREDTLSSSAPAQIYEESDLIKRSIRDAYSNDIEEVMVEGDDAYKEAKAFMKMLVPSHAPRVKHYKSEIPLFYEYSVEEALLLMNEPVVKLKSGGYIVMNPTEALISIDVNSGRSTGERNIEETAYKTNAEAAQEIARQLRLRDLAGLIVIDFIDMMEGKNRRNIERLLKEALRNDRAKIQIGRISPFGLLEMSRQRLRPSISEAMSRTCPHCQGTGLVRSDATVAIQIIRTMEKEAGHAVIEKFRIFLTPSVAVYLLNHMRTKLHSLELEYNLIIETQIDPLLQDGAFRIEKTKNKEKSREKEIQLRHDRAAQRAQAAAEAAAEEARLREEGALDEEENEDSPRNENDNEEEGERRSRRRNRNRNRDRNNRWKRDKDGSSAEDISSETATTPIEENVTILPRESSKSALAEDSPENERKYPPRRGRGRKAAAQHETTRESASEVHLSPAQFPALRPTSTEPELAVLAEKKPEKPARKGWWQKIIE